MIIIGINSIRETKQSKNDKNANSKDEKRIDIENHLNGLSRL